MHVCAHVKARVAHQVSSSIVFLLFLLTSEPLGSSCLSLPPSTGITGMYCHIWILYGHWGVWTQVLTNLIH